jgi:pimeloyl-ACP methyl ester carboxylesterase
MVGMTFGAPAVRAFAKGMRLIPNRRLPFLADIVAEVLQRDPAPSGAVIEGLFFGRTAPPRSERAGFRAPTLVIGHRRDPIHPFSDSDMLVGELPNARLVEAGSIIEMRIAPERLTGEIAAFVDECWRPTRAAPKRRAS